MTPKLLHDLAPTLSPDDLARQHFASGMLRFANQELGGDMAAAYDRRVLPAFKAKHGRSPSGSREVHLALRPDLAFQLYSVARVRAQEMVWESVMPVVERERKALEVTADRLASLPGTLELDPSLVPPRSMAAIDVHLMPGSYVAEEVSPLEAGAIYDQGYAVFMAGALGDNSDDIGLSFSHYVKSAFPDFAPTAILDIGCTIGHNTLPWKAAYPDAQVHAVDPAAACLRYGSARAKSQGAEIHFRQMLGEKLDYADDSFDLVFTSMVLHEISLPSLRAMFKEIKRVLKPGGLMLHMEVPPNNQLADVYQHIHTEFATHYNEEPFMKVYADQDPKALCIDGGFDADRFVQIVTPSFSNDGPEAIDRAATDSTLAVKPDRTGVPGFEWFGFGAWKN